MNKINHQILCILLDYMYIAKWCTVHTISKWFIFVVTINTWEVIFRAVHEGRLRWPPSTPRVSRAGLKKLLQGLQQFQQRDVKHLQSTHDIMPPPPHPDIAPMKICEQKFTFVQYINSLPWAMYGHKLRPANSGAISGLDCIAMHTGHHFVRPSRWNCTIHDNGKFPVFRRMFRLSQRTDGNIICALWSAQTFDTRQICWSRGSTVSIVTALQAGRSGLRIQAGARCFSLFPKHPNRLWGPANLLSNSCQSMFRRSSGKVGKLTTQLHLAPMLRMSGAVPLLALCAFMAWTGATLPLRLFNYRKKILVFFDAAMWRANGYSTF